MRIFWLIIFSICNLISAEEKIEKTVDKPFNPKSIAYHISVIDLGEDGWNDFVKKTQQRLDDYLNSPGGGSVEAFLNDRLTDIGNEVNENDIASLKKLVAWIGLYFIWKVELPEKANKPLQENRAQIEKLIQEGFWAKLAIKIKEKK